MLNQVNIGGLMAGAMAGSAILHAPVRSDKLDTVTATINNACNLSCPHCYLQYAGSGVISHGVLERIYDSDFRHIAIVGKEPTLNPDIVEKVIELSDGFKRTVSIVTNGIFIERFSSNVLSSLKFLDISLDGGPETYSRYTFADICAKIKYVYSAGCKQMNILHTIYKENLKNVDDMIAVGEFVDFDKMLFSPYLTSRNHGRNFVTPVSLIKDILPRLSESKPFRDEPRAFLLISGLHLRAEKLGLSELNEKIKEIGMSKKVLIFDKDPIERGFIRVNYDGGVLTPFQSLHPEDYENSEFVLDGTKSLKEIFQIMRNKN